MAKLPMCRICLVENVRMFVVADKNLQEIYEKLTDVPFVTEDNRPMLTCFFCYAKLKQSYQLQRKCLEAEELFAQMLNNCELKPLPNRGHSEFVGGFVTTVIENISIVDDGQTDSGTIEIELPMVSEKQCDIVQIKVERQNDDLEPENVDIYPDIADIPPYHSESDSEDDVPLLEFKTEVVEVKEDTEEQEVSKTKQKTKNAKRAPAVRKSNLKNDTSIAKQKKTGPSDLKAIRPNQSRTSKSVKKFKEPVTITKPKVNNSVIHKSNDHYTEVKTNLIDYIHSAIDTSFCNKSDLKFKILNKKSIVSEDSSRHSKPCVKEKVYRCEICQQCFSARGHLRKHILEHGEKPFKCHFCQRGFDAKCHLDKHVRIHTGEKPYKCDVCQRSFSEKSNLIKHISRHTGVKPYKCDICQRSFNQKCQLISHSLLHTGEKPYKCEVCQQGFNRLYNFKQHYRTHTGEKPHNCIICQRSFTHKTSLTNHLRKHTGEKPYKCFVCQRSFPHKQSLDMHFRKHTGEKPYKCEHCQRCFTQSSHLKQHLRTHIGEIPYDQLSLSQSTAGHRPLPGCATTPCPPPSASSLSQALS